MLPKKNNCGNMFNDAVHMYEKKNNIGSEGDVTVSAMRSRIADVIEGNCKTPELRFISFKMTNYCNSDCGYCIHAISRHEEHKSTIPFEIIERTVKDAKQLGCTAIAINGGEPLLMPDAAKIVRCISDVGIVPVLMTNALLLPQKWEELGDAGLRYVIISFDSLDKETYEKQRGASYDAAMEGIEAALKMREKYGDVEIFISATLTTDNFEDIVELIKFTTAKNIKIQFSPFHNYLHDGDKEFKVSEEKVNSIVNTLIQMKKDGYLIASSVAFIRHFKDYFLFNKKVPNNYHCKMGYANLCINSYMDVRVCWSKNFPVLGNIGKSSLIDIWNSPVAQEYRQNMYDGKCEGCWYMCTEITMLIENTMFGD